MRFKTRLAFLCLLLITIHSGCDSKNTNSDCDGGTIGIHGNLVPNSSFESRGEPSMNGWQFSERYPPRILADAPDSGGCYSLGIGAGWIPMRGSAWASISGIQSGEVLRLSASVKGGSGIGLTAKPQPSMDGGKWIFSSDSSWTKLTIVDTVSLEPGAPVYVVLVGPTCEVCLETGQFDLVTLVRE